MNDQIHSTPVVDIQARMPMHLCSARLKPIHEDIERRRSDLNVAHIITGLDRGGAEGVMLRLCQASHGNEFRHTVYSLTGRGEIAEALENRGIAVTSLGMGSAASAIPAIWRLRGLLGSAPPDVVQTWMYHADLIGGIAARLAGIRPLVWGVRNSVADAPVMKTSTRYVIRLCALLSGFVPDKIIVCAKNALDSHARAGYRRDKMAVIQNGIDTRHFYRADENRVEWRESMGLHPEVPLIGMVARASPQKDHANLLNALGRNVAAGTLFQCVLIGEGIDESNSTLLRQIEDLGLRDHVILAGLRADIPDVMRALDLHVLSSRVEGFPNVLAEAMACGTPCVSSDVGDADGIVSDHGWIVPSEDPVALAEAMGEALLEFQNLPENWRQRRANCEKHIREEFGLQRMVAEYADAWRAAAQHG